jgi:hypothetical protein
LLLIAALDNADDNGLDEDGNKVKFKDYFNFYNGLCDAVKIHPQITGRITDIRLQSAFKENFHFYFSLPPIIENFQSLESIDLWNFHSISPLCIYRYSKQSYSVIAQRIYLEIFQRD